MKTFRGSGIENLESLESLQIDEKSDEVFDWFAPYEKLAYCEDGSVYDCSHSSGLPPNAVFFLIRQRGNYFWPGCYVVTVNRDAVTVN